jgi:hypothetical protein
MKEAGGINRPDITVSGDVSVEVGGMTECLVAVRALVGRGGAVSCLMLLQVGLLAKPFLANYTLERSLACGK